MSEEPKKPVIRVTDEGMRAIEDGIGDTFNLFVGHTVEGDTIVVNLGFKATEHDYAAILRLVSECHCQVCRVLTAELTSDQ
jgi:hypothetical protein